MKAIIQYHQSRARDLFESLREGGALEIEKMVAAQQTEELFLDYKRAVTPANIRGLAEDDAKNYSKSVSGFGNSAGGIVVWGVDCRPNAEGADVPQQLIPIDNPLVFKTKLDEQLSAVTLPPHPLVQNIELTSEHGPSGFVVTYVPKGLDTPLQALKGKKGFYIRIGSRFDEIPYEVLAGMFGKQPQPLLEGRFRYQTHHFHNSSSLLEIDLGVELSNLGRGSAQDVHLTLGTGRDCSGMVRFRVEEIDSLTMRADADRVRQHLVSEERFSRIVPGASRPLCQMKLIVPMHTVGEITIEGNCGATGSPTSVFQSSISADTLHEVISQYSMQLKPPVTLQARRQKLDSILRREIDANSDS